MFKCLKKKKAINSEATRQPCLVDRGEKGPGICAVLGTPSNTVFSQESQGSCQPPHRSCFPAQTVSALPCDVTKTNPSAGGASVVVTGSALLKVGPHSGRNWWRVWRSTCVPKKEGPSGEMGALIRFSSQRPLGLVLFPKLLILTVTWGHLKNTGPFPRPQK